MKHPIVGISLILGTVFTTIGLVKMFATASTGNKPGCLTASIIDISHCNEENVCPVLALTESGDLVLLNVKDPQPLDKIEVCE